MPGGTMPPYSAVEANLRAMTGDSFAAATAALQVNFGIIATAGYSGIATTLRIAPYPSIATSFPQSTIIAIAAGVGVPLVVGLVVLTACLCICIRRARQRSTSGGEVQKVKPRDAPVFI